MTSYWIRSLYLLAAMGLVSCSASAPEATTRTDAPARTDNAPPTRATRSADRTADLEQQLATMQNRIEALQLQHTLGQRQTQTLLQQILDASRSEPIFFTEPETKQETPPTVVTQRADEVEANPVAQETPKETVALVSASPTLPPADEPAPKSVVAAAPKPTPPPAVVATPAPAAKLAPKRSPRRTGISLQLHWQPQAQFAGYIMAVEKGFFKEAGVGDVKLIWSGPGDSPLSELASGKVDFCTAWFADAIVRRSKGSPVVLLSQIMRDSAMMLITWADDGIDAPEKMTGKRVGLWGGDFSIPPKAFFYKYKIKPIVTPQTPSIQPFMLRAVSVASAMYYNEYHRILQTGTKPEQLKVFALADYGLNIPEDGLYTTEAMRKDRPATCRKLSAAIQKGWDYAFEHEAETIEAVMEYCKTHKVNTNRSHQRWMLQAMKKYIKPEDKTHRFGQLTGAMYDDAIELLQQQKVLLKAPEYGMFYQPTH